MRWVNLCEVQQDLQSLNSSNRIWSPSIELLSIVSSIAALISLYSILNKESQTLSLLTRTTGSFRKNGKSILFVKITIFTQIKLSQLFQVQNQRQIYPPRHPGPTGSPKGIQKSLCLQCDFSILLAVWGQTQLCTNSETLIKDPHRNLKLSGENLAVWTYSSLFTTIMLSFTNWNTQFESLPRVSESVIGLKQSTRAWKHIWGTNSFGCLGLIVMDLDAEGDKFVANSGLKQLRKLNLCENCDFNKQITFAILSERPCKQWMLL